MITARGHARAYGHEVRLSGAATVDPVDVRSIAASVAELVDCWRALRFDDGLIVVGHPGERREGLQVVSGAHPRPGTSYRVAFAEPDPRIGERLEQLGQKRANTTPFLVDLNEDTSESLRFRLAFTDPGPISVAVDLDRPRALRSASASLDGQVEGGWLARGHVSGHGAIDLDPLPHLRLRLRHRRARGSVAIKLHSRHDGRWDVTLDVRARSAGLIRPFVAIATPWLGAKAGARLRTAMADLPNQVSAFNRRWRAEVAQHGERGIAQRWVDEFLDALR